MLDSMKIMKENNIYDFFYFISQYKTYINYAHAETIHDLILWYIDYEV